MRPPILEQQERAAQTTLIKEAVRDFEKKYPLANKTFNLKEYAIGALLDANYVKQGEIYAKGSFRASIVPLSYGIDTKFAVHRKPTGRYLITFWEVK
jgi:hypothetical protein